ncbi:SDR family oxidoreductase [Phenylobacterium montanum]|uniref:SDR family oxidoreductase n=1 Tax=Phenylobacterium montanum TaxID=2823693 RepID=A0A975G388_9CAUL|nr:SDR family oxidoreductase [Caulobacter sp. S6]QUD90070.1 SDR family oxidoreductase [Caulobacter sp. S6]
MRVFLTGATGFIGSTVIEELHAAGHQVVGLARSDIAAAALKERGVEVWRGDVADPAGLAEAARGADGVIHCAFGHDFSNYLEAGEADLRAVSAMAQALAGSGKPLVVTSGLTAATPGRASTEADPAQTEGMGAVRGRPEALALEASQSGVRSMVVRLAPSVHDRGQQGLVSQLIETARRTGVSAYVGDGGERWPAVHRRDAARLFRLALERGQPGQRLHAVGEEGVSLRAIAEVVGERLGLPTRSVDFDDAFNHFGWVAAAVANDIRASSVLTQESLGWRPMEPGLLEGLRGLYLP